jgi:NAD(P)-dependent dehydrogenase (short-subunit alcohol dehydrogenase family)
MNKLLLEGKTAIVSGASYGMGKEMAAVLAAEGANVLMTARGKEKLDAAVEEVRAAGGKAVGMTMNTSKADDVRAMFAKTLKEFGQIDIVVNNAAKGELVCIEAMTDELIDEVVNTNLKGLLYSCREAMKYMLPRGSGSIINIASVNGVRPMCGAAYSSTKGGVITLTQNVAIRCVGTGVRCNAIAPGFTFTPTAAHHEEVPHTLADGMMNEIRDARTVRSVPTQPIDQANAVLFFASDLSKAVNGQTLVVDNGSYL